jgi:rRNA-processing protein FCF1
VDIVLTALVLGHRGRFGSSLFDDTSLLLGLKREGLICALADTSRLLECAQKDLKTNTKSKEGSSRSAKVKGSSRATQLKTNLRVEHENKTYSKSRSSDSRRLQTAQKKVYFMMCWVNEQSTETFETLIDLVQKEKSMLIVDTGSRELETISSNSEFKVKSAENAVTAPRKAVIQELETISSSNEVEVKEAERATTAPRRPLIQELG